MSRHDGYVEIYTMSVSDVSYYVEIDHTLITSIMTEIDESVITVINTGQSKSVFQILANQVASNKPSWQLT